MLSSRSLNSAILALALLAPALLAGCDRQSGQKAQPQASAQALQSGAAKSDEFTGTIDRTHKGSPLPAFTLTDQAGHKLLLQSLKGKPLLINLWATWCAPCIAELPTLDRLAAYRDGAYRIVTVSQDMAKTETIAAFLKDRGLTRLEPWLDPKNDLAFAYDAGTLPTTIYYDASGKEVWRFTGGHDWANPETTSMLAEGENH